VVLVRGTAAHDARLLREARVLESMGEEVVVLGVTSTEETAPAAEVGDVTVVRLSPRSPFELLRRFRGRRAQAARAAASDEGVGSPARSPVALADPGPLASAALRAHRLLRTIDFYRRAIGAIRAWRPRMVHCNDYNTMWVGVAARLLGAKVIYDAHELWPDRNQRQEPRWWLVACEALFVRAANRMLATSPGHAAVIARRYRVREPTVIRNIPRRPEPRDDFAGELDERLAIYVGAVTTNRGLEQCISALQRADQVRLRIVGPGRAEYRSELTDLAQRLDVAERVEIADPLAPDQVVEAAARAGSGVALIQPSCLSYAECLPNKLFEYVVAGLPVLASDLPVLGGFVREHGIGPVVRPDRIDEIAEQLQALADPAVNARYREAVLRAREQLDPGRESRLLQSVYEDALADRA
jgi:glycosyltransferase involved in cell wall biosynthesis